MTICLLPETLASSIAVGEVVERPALVFKELVENSLDVRATRIEISLRDGGSCIPVTDDGAGMARDECPVARDGGHPSHSGQCNHGRPTYMEPKLTNIEKFFGRR